MSDYLVVYDVELLDKKRDSRRLRNLAKVCEAYGVRVQKSVFECSLDPVLFEEFLCEVEDVIDPSRDVVYIYALHGDLSSRRIVLGEPPEHEFGSPWLF